MAAHHIHRPSDPDDPEGTDSAHNTESAGDTQGPGPDLSGAFDPDGATRHPREEGSSTADGPEDRAPDPRPHASTADAPGATAGRGTPAAGPPGPTEGVGADRINLSSPNDVVATLPYLVGEPPEPGLVVLTLRGFAVRSVLCRDLHRTDTTDPLACVRPPVDSAVAEGADALLVIGYGTAEQVSGRLKGLVALADRRGLKVLEAFRVHAGRYWSQMCERPACCPPEGTELDPARSTGPADAVLRGLVPRPPLRTLMEEIDRARRRLRPPEEQPPEALRAATAAAESEVERLRGSGVRVLRRCGAAVVRAAAAAERAGTGPHTIDELARLAVFLRERPVRDTVWGAITPETAPAHLELWSRVTRGAEPADRAAPASLVAVAAWQREESPLARAALETALEADPGYSMALLMRQALEVGLPAQRWIEHLQGRSE